MAKVNFSMQQELERIVGQTEKIKSEWQVERCLQLLMADDTTASVFSISKCALLNLNFTNMSSWMILLQYLQKKTPSQLQIQ